MGVDSKFKITRIVEIIDILLSYTGGTTHVTYNTTSLAQIEVGEGMGMMLLISPGILLRLEKLVPIYLVPTEHVIPIISIKSYHCRRMWTLRHPNRAVCCAYDNII